LIIVNYVHSSLPRPINQLTQGIEQKIRDVWQSPKSYLYELWPVKQRTAVAQALPILVDCRADQKELMTREKLKRLFWGVIFYDNL